MSEDHEVSLNTKILLARVPTENYPKENEDVFQIKYVPPTPTDQVADGQVVIRNLYISIDATMRVWISGVQSYMPPVKPQDVMRAFCVGQVIFSKSKKIKVGDLVSGLLGWQKFAVMKDNELAKLPKDYPNPEHFLGVLGISGLTAYFGLHDVGKIKPTDTVVISAATGAVGEIAVQLAKNFGCNVCAIAGGTAKCNYAKSIGADTVIDYKSENVHAKLKQLYPKGIDVYFDNVGGQMLDDVLMHIRKDARVILCGLISTYGQKEPHKLKNYSRLIVKTATIQGYLYMDYSKKFPEAIAQLLSQMKQNKLKFRVNMLYGIEQAPRGLKMLLNGENEGKVMIQVDHKSQLSSKL